VNELLYQKKGGPGKGLHVESFSLLGLIDISA